MAKESRGNPFAEDYRPLIDPAKPPPPVVIGAKIEADIRPSLEWLAAHRNELAEAERDGLPMPTCPSEEAVVRLTLVGMVMVPKATISPQNWPMGQAPVGILDTMPWPKFRDLIVQLNPHLEAELGAVVIPTAGKN